MKERGLLEAVYKSLGYTPEEQARHYRLRRECKPDIPDNPKADRELKESIFYWNEVFRKAELPPLLVAFELAGAADRWLEQVLGKGSK